MSEVNEELISAYLDDELSPAERKLVDTALARDPKLQQLKEDLERLHSDFELLPVYRPQDTQQAIRQAMSQDGRLPVGDSEKIKLRSSSSKKLWLTAGASLAACLLLAVTLLVQQNDNTGELALTDSSSTQPPAADFSDDEIKDRKGYLSEEGGMSGAMGGMMESSMEDMGVGGMNEEFNALEQRRPAGDEKLEKTTSSWVDEVAREADQTIRVKISKSQLDALLATIAPLEFKESGNAPASRKGVSSEEKSIADDADNQLNGEIKRRNIEQQKLPLVYAIEQTPEQLDKLKARLRAANYLPEPDITSSDAGRPSTKINGKLRVLVLITIQPEPKAKSD